MTLLIAIFAAVISTVVWYRSEDRKEMQLGTLSLMFWGASLMWLVDAFFGYAEKGAAFFTPEASDMLNEIYLGLSVVALALVIWLVILLVKDPQGRVKAALLRR
ncbi:MAG: hypothetical protein K5697_00600 [Lachnospiraceae bacterium]|nr:hypothetical protein [Lachnospiraceae bacterium]